MHLPPIERVYLIGSLRSDLIRPLANKIRSLGVVVYDSWHAAGPRADDIWKEYEQQRGRSFLEALRGEHARDVFSADSEKIEKSDTGVLVMPSGKSAHMELGYMLGERKRGYILLEDDADRWDIMYQFATDVFMREVDLLSTIQKGTRQ